MLLQYLGIISEKLITNLLVTYKELHNEEYESLKEIFQSIDQYKTIVREYPAAPKIFPSLIDLVEKELNSIGERSARNILALALESAGLFIENLKEMLSPIIVPIIISLVIFDNDTLQKFSKYF